MVKKSLIILISILIVFQYTEVFARSYGGRSSGYRSSGSRSYKSSSGSSSSKKSSSSSSSSSKSTSSSTAKNNSTTSKSKHSYDSKSGKYVSSGYSHNEKYNNVGGRPVYFNNGGSGGILSNPLLLYLLISQPFNNSKMEQVSEIKPLTNFMLKSTNKEGLTNGNIFVQTNDRIFYNYTTKSLLLETSFNDYELKDVYLNESDTNMFNTLTNKTYHYEPDDENGAGSAIVISVIIFLVLLMIGCALI